MIAPIRAWLRYDALTTASYRVRTVLALGGLVVGVVPLYFVAGALQPMMGPQIEGQGSQYFSFVILGMVAHRFANVMVNALPTAIQSGVRTGTLEAVFATPTPVPSLLGGMISFRVAWTALEVTAFVTAGVVLGATFLLPTLLPVLLLLALIAASYLPFGLVAAALVLTVRSPGPVPTLVGVGSLLLGGVYYPTESIPSWIEHLSVVVPLTYGLRALRGVALEGLPLQAVAGDVAVLAAMTAVLMVGGALALRKSLDHARFSGTLAQY